MCHMPSLCHTSTRCPGFKDDSAMVPALQSSDSRDVGTLPPDWCMGEVPENGDRILKEVIVLGCQTPGQSGAETPS